MKENRKSNWSHKYSNNKRLRELQVAKNKLALLLHKLNAKRIELETNE